MPDLFDSMPPQPKAHHQEGFFRPKPWFGCDTSSPAWRDYCEAWTILHQFADAEMDRIIFMRAATRHRGKNAGPALEHNVKLVESDLKGDIADRSKLPEMLK